MTSTEVANSLNCTPRHVRNITKKATNNNTSTITVKGEIYTFVEVVTVASRGKAYCYTSVQDIVKKRKTTSKSMSFFHLEELRNLNITAKKHTKEEKLLLITFIGKYDYTLKIIIESLLANIAEPREPKLVASLTRKVQRWRKEFSTNGVKALDDQRGKTRKQFSKIDEELLIKAIYGAGARGIRENYYGVWDFYCFAYQKKNEQTFTTINKKVISYSAIRRAIFSIFKVNKTVESYWKKGEDGLLQSYPVGIKDITYTNQEWQVDATKFDFMCRYVGADGGVKIGRLNLTAVIDVHSGNAVATLSETITSYDQVRVIHKAFERMGMPEQVYTDNGKDYVSYHYSDVIADLGITQIMAQVGQGRQKGKIERFFGVIQTDLAKIAGYIGNNVAKRTIIEDQTASKIARRTGKATRIGEDRLLTFEELQTMVDNWTAKAANSYAEQEQHLLSTNELEDVRRKLGKKSTRPLHNDGIKLNGFTYISSALWVNGLSKGNDIEVYEDIDNINTIYVYHNDSYIGEAFNRELGVEAMSLEEHKQAKKADRKNNIAPAQKIIRSSKELYAQYQDHHAKELLEFTPEYAKPKEKEVVAPVVTNNDYMNFVKKQQA
jgi:transposase InsO family protein